MEPTPGSEAHELRQEFKALLELDASDIHEGSIQDILNKVSPSESSEVEREFKRFRGLLENAVDIERKLNARITQLEDREEMLVKGWESSSAYWEERVEELEHQNEALEAREKRLRSRLVITSL